MSVQFLQPRLDPESRRLAVTIRNLSTDTWRKEEEFAAGCQVFDSDSDTLVVDGQRALLGADLAPGESAEIWLELALPLENGRYRVLVSLMREDVCWFYARGWRFLLIDAEVTGGRVTVRRMKVSTAGALRRERWLRSLGRVFRYPAAAIWDNRGLIRSMVRRDISSRYRGSFVGLFWTVLNPLLLMATYFFVFGIVLRTRFGSDPSRSGFVLYFLAGMLPWLAFSEAAGRAPFVIFEHRNFVKKLVFPLETLPVNLVVAGLVTEIFAAAVFLIGLLLARGAVAWTVLWLPALLAPQLLFTLGVCWFLAALGVYVRDLAQVIGFLLTLWFFLTPICYPVESLPAEALWLLAKNPLFVLVSCYRAVLLEGHAPAPAALAKLWLVAAAAFFLGHAWFHKLRKNFADVI